MPFVPDQPGGFVPDGPQRPKVTVNPPNWIERKLAQLPDIPGAQKGGPIDTFVRGMADPSIPADYVGNKVTDIANSMGSNPDVAAGLGTVANLGVQAAPLALGGIAKTAAPLMRSGAERLMGSALNAPLKYRQTGAAPKAINTLLDEGVNVTQGGVDKLQMMIDSLKGDVRNALGSSNATIDKGAVGTRLQDLISEIEKHPTPNAARRSVEGVYDEYMGNPLVPNQIPVQQAQTMKQAIYDDIESKYGQLVNDTNDVAAKKALGRGFREELEKAVPDVIDPNAAQSELINARKLARLSVLKNNGSSLAGLAPLAHGPSGLAAMLLDKNALAKSLVARGMNAGQTKIPVTAAEMAILGSQMMNQKQPRSP